MSVSDQLNKEKWHIPYMEMDENGIVQYSNKSGDCPGPKDFVGITEKKKDML